MLKITVYYKICWVNCIANMKAICLTYMIWHKGQDFRYSNLGFSKEYLWASHRRIFGLPPPPENIPVYHYLNYFLWKSWLLKTSSPSAFMMTYLREYGPECIYCFQVSVCHHYLFLLRIFFWSILLAAWFWHRGGYRETVPMKTNMSPNKWTTVCLSQ